MEQEQKILNSVNSFIEELTWRGMLNNMTPGVEDLFKSEPVTGYIGFDPTSDSLHIGNLAQIMTLKHFQRCGNKPIVLVGDATAKIGDPSGRFKSRELLMNSILESNTEAISKQLRQYLDFDCKYDTRAEIIYNSSWYKTMSVMTYMQSIARHMPINQMLAKDSVSDRSESMSLSEFNYQAYQAYDFCWLRGNYNCKLQLGGSDQWGNMVAGIDLCKKKK